MSKEKLSLTKQSQILILSQVICFAFNFCVPIIVVRFFDMTQYGVYKQIFLVFMTLSVILPFGIVESLYYFIPRNREQKHHYITHTIIFLILGGSIYLLIMIFFGKKIFSCINLSSIYDYIVPLSFYTVFMCISLPFEKLMIIEERVKAASIISVASEVFKGIIIVVAVVLTRKLLFVIYALMLFSFIRLSVFSYYICSNRLLLFSFKEINSIRIKEHFMYSYPFGLAVIVATIRRFLHQFVITYMFVAKDFAIYSVGLFQIPLMLTVFQQVSNVVLIRISGYQKDNNYKKIVEIWLNSARKLALIFFAVTFFFIIASREFVTILFTDRYLDSVPIFIVALLELPFNIFVTHSILKSFAENRFILKLNILVLILNILFLYIFVSIYGMIGAVISTVASFGLIRILEIIKVRKLLRVSFNELIPWRIFIKILSICFLCGLFPVLMKKLMGNAPPLQIFILELFLFFIPFFLMVYCSSLITIGEKTEINRIIKKLMNPLSAST